MQYSEEKMDNSELLFSEESYSETRTSKNRPFYMREIEAITDIPTGSKQQDKDKVSLDNFWMLDFLGRGGFGIVYLVQKKNGVDAGKLYAMKVLNKLCGYNNQKKAENLTSERLALELIGTGHPFVVGLHYAFQTDIELYLVMDYVRSGSLTQHVKKHGAFDENQVRLYVAQLILALDHLEKLGIVHRDLKTDNILLENDYHLKIVDFGLCKILKPGAHEQSNTFCGTLAFMPPEIFRLSPNGNNMSRDWWSVGVITLLLLTGKAPFDTSHKGGKSIFQQIKAWSESDIPSELSPVTRNFINKLMQKEPLQRLGTIGGVAEVKKDPFFEGLDWFTLYKSTLHLYSSTRNYSPSAGYNLLIVTSPTIPEMPLPDSTNFNLFNNFSYVAPEYLRKKVVEANAYTGDQREYCNLPLINPKPFPSHLVKSGWRCSGSFGDIFMVTDQKSSNTKYLMKVVKNKDYRPSEVDALLSLNQIDGSFICKYINTYRKMNKIMIVTEYFEGPYLSECIDGGLSEKTCQNIFAQIVQGLNYIHKCRFVHGNIKPQSIVFTDNSRTSIKIVDLRYATYSSHLEYWYDRPRYTLAYAPPEAWKHKKYAIYSPAFDIWSLGATLFHIYMGHEPFKKSFEGRHINKKVMQYRIEHLEMPMRTPRWLEASVELRNVILSCMTLDRNERIALADLKKHLWVKDHYPPRT